MAANFIIDVSEQDFEYEVLNFSHNTPVIVDFWAEWCRPCKQLSPLLEALANEAQGGFRLAKVNVDENPNLALRYTVRSLPTVKAFVDGEVVGEFVGMQPVERIRDFFNRLVPPSPLQLEAEKAEGMLAEQRWQIAEGLFRDLLDKSPDNPHALLGLSKALLAQGQAQEALYTLRSFPLTPQLKQAELLRPLAEAMTALAEGSLPDESDLDSAYQGSLRLAKRGKILPALDGLLDILRQERRYRGGAARQCFVALLEILGEDHPETRQYRAELAAILF